MRVARTISRALSAWVAWRARRSLVRAIPALADLDAQRSTLARQHRSGAKAIDIERKRLVTARLRFELGGEIGDQIAALESTSPRSS